MDLEPNPTAMPALDPLRRCTAEATDTCHAGPRATFAADARRRGPPIEGERA